jgi:hypothetical protein
MGKFGCFHINVLLPMLTKQLRQDSAAVGGPTFYLGRDMRQAHKQLPAEFTAAAAPESMPERVKVEFELDAEVLDWLDGKCPVLPTRCRNFLQHPETVDTP